MEDELGDTLEVDDDEINEFDIVEDEVDDDKVEDEDELEAGFVINA